MQILYLKIMGKNVLRNHYTHQAIYARVHNFVKTIIGIVTNYTNYYW